MGGKGRGGKGKREVTPECGSFFCSEVCARFPEDAPSRPLDDGWAYAFMIGRCNLKCPTSTCSRLHPKEFCDASNDYDSPLAPGTECGCTKWTGSYQGDFRIKCVKAGPPWDTWYFVSREDGFVTILAEEQLPSKPSYLTSVVQLPNVAYSFVAEWDPPIEVGPALGIPGLPNVTATEYQHYMLRQRGEEVELDWFVPEAGGRVISPCKPLLPLPSPSP